MLRILVIVFGIVWGLNPQSIKNNFLQISVNEVRNFQYKTHLGYSGYLSGHFLQVNSQKDFTLKVAQQEYYGYPVDLGIGFGVFQPKKELPLGLFYQYRRFGFSTEAYQPFKENSPSHLIHSHHLSGLTWQNSDLLLNLGWSGSFWDLSNEQSLHKILIGGQYSIFGIQALFNPSKFWIRTTLLLEENLNNSLGFHAYLPRLSFEYAEEHKFRWDVEQNIFKRQLYAVLGGDNTSLWGEATLYADSTRFFKYSANVLKTDKKMFWGHSLQLGLLELGYNTIPVMNEDIVSNKFWAKVIFNINTDSRKRFFNAGAYVSQELQDP